MEQGKSGSTGDRPGKPVWIIAGVVSTVLLAGAAGWGGSLLANNTAAERTIAADTATTTAGTSSPTAAPTSPTATSSASDITTAAETSRAQARVPAPAPAPAPASEPAPAPAPPPAPAPKPAPAPPPAPPTVNCSLYYSLKEQIRVSYQAKLFNINNEWNQALNRGDLDEAARLYSNAQAVQQQQSIDEQRLALQYPGC